MKRIWPKTFFEYLIIPVTFPLWILLRIVNPKMTDTYFFNQDKVLAEQSEPVRMREPDMSDALEERVDELNKENAALKAELELSRDRTRR